MPSQEYEAAPPDVKRVFVQAVKKGRQYMVTTSELNGLNQTRAALGALTKAIDFGYDDFEHLKGDTDLDNLLKDEHFQHYIKQLEKKKKPTKQL